MVRRIFAAAFTVFLLVSAISPAASADQHTGAEVNPEIAVGNTDNQRTYKLLVEISSQAENIAGASFTVTARDGSTITSDNLTENELAQLRSFGGVTVEREFDNAGVQRLRGTDIYVVTVEIDAENTIPGGVQVLRNYNVSPVFQVSVENSRIRPASDNQYSMVLVFSDNSNQSSSYTSFEYWADATTDQSLIGPRVFTENQLEELNNASVVRVSHLVSRSVVDWASGFDIHVAYTTTRENENGQTVENREGAWSFGLVPSESGGYNTIPGRQDVQINLENSNFSLIDFQHEDGIIDFGYRARPTDGVSARTLSVDTPGYYERTDASYSDNILQEYSALLGGNDVSAIKSEILSIGWPAYDFVNTPEYRIEIGSDVVARYDELNKGRSGWEKLAIVGEVVITVVDIAFLTHGVASLATVSSEALATLTISQLAKEAFGTVKSVALKFIVAEVSAAGAVATYAATSHPVEGENTKAFVTLQSARGYTHFWADTTIQPTGPYEENFAWWNPVDWGRWGDFQLTYGGIGKVVYSMGSPYRSFAAVSGGRTIITDNKLVGLWGGADVKQIIFGPSDGSIVRHILEIEQTEIKTGEDSILAEARDESRWLNCIEGSERLEVADMVGESALEESYGSILSAEAAGPSRVFLDIKDVDLDYHLKGSWIIRAYQDNGDGALSVVVNGENRIITIPENGMVEINNDTRSGSLTLTVYDKDRNVLYRGSFSAQRAVRWGDNGTIEPENPADDPNEAARQDWDRTKWGDRWVEGVLIPAGMVTPLVVLGAIIFWRRRKK